uniref:Uncharacterized protein n=1 Tax=Arundo donax TaxID=35708 RepID=A0A0A8ZK45_ARUDO
MSVEFKLIVMSSFHQYQLCEQILRNIYAIGRFPTIDIIARLPYLNVKDRSMFFNRSFL